MPWVSHPRSPGSATPATTQAKASFGVSDPKGNKYTYSILELHTPLYNKRTGWRLAPSLLLLRLELRAATRTDQSCLPPCPSIKILPGRLTTFHVQRYYPNPSDETTPEPFRWGSKDITVSMSWLARDCAHRRPRLNMCPGILVILRGISAHPDRQPAESEKSHYWCFF